MSAKKIAAEKVAKTAEKPAAETPAVAEKPAAETPAAETPAAEDAPDVETPGPVVRKRTKQTVDEFADALLSEHFTPQVVAYWGQQVVANVGLGIPVTITESAEGAPLLNIHYGHSYRGAVEKGTEAGINIDVNSAVLAKFPAA